LRSAEVAVRAGIDPGYYAKLEQGRATSPSPEVLDAIGRALELNEAESQHLFDLASQLRRARPTLEPEYLPPGAREVLDGLAASPAYIFGRTYDLLAWNDGMCAVFGDPSGLPPEKRNVIWMMFSIPPMREFIDDWEGHAQRLLAQFRFDSGRHRGDARFAEVVAELSATSPEFRDWWPRRDVQGRLELTKQVTPPAYGKPIVFLQTTWAFSTAPNIRLVVYAPNGDENLARSGECIRALLAGRKPEDG
jgi:transcriptional regulator with XRE-family HTH domain